MICTLFWLHWGRWCISGWLMNWWHGSVCLWWRCMIISGWIWCMSWWCMSWCLCWRSIMRWCMSWCQCMRWWGHGGVCLWRRRVIISRWLCWRSMSWCLHRRWMSWWMSRNLSRSVCWDFDISSLYQLESPFISCFFFIARTSLYIWNSYSTKLTSKSIYSS